MIITKGSLQFRVPLRSKWQSWLWAVRHLICYLNDGYCHLFACLVSRIAEKVV